MILYQCCGQEFTSKETFEEHLQLKELPVIDLLNEDGKEIPIPDESTFIIPEGWKARKITVKYI